MVVDKAPTSMDYFNPFFRIMTTSLLDEATQVIPNPQVLINVVSKRVRQLTQGHRPMVEVGARLDYADIALREIIEGKIGYELVSEEEQQA